MFFIRLIAGLAWSAYYFDLAVSDIPALSVAEQFDVIAVLPLYHRCSV